MRLRQFPPLFFIGLLMVLGLAGCTARLTAQVSGVVEEGYAPAGQSYSLELLPGMPAEDVPFLDSLKEQLRDPLAALGYMPATSQEAAQTTIRVCWFSTGPHPVYRTVYVDDGIGRFNRWRRTRVVVDEVYHRYLVIEAIAPPPPAENWASLGVRNVREALRLLPPAPSRLVWRVTAESAGNLARAARVLPELTAAAIPLLGKAGAVRVRVQGTEILGIEEKSVVD